MADFKESPAEIFGMPQRDPSLDDFEKLENFCTQEKSEDDSQFERDLLGLETKDTTSSPLSFDPATTEPFDDFIRPIKNIEKEDNLKEHSLFTSVSNDPYSELMDFPRAGDRSPKQTSNETNGNDASSLQDFDIPSFAALSEAVSASVLPDEEGDYFQAGLRDEEKPVHLKSAPSDSGCGLSPSEETALGHNPPAVDKIVPSAPEIAHHVSTVAAEPLVKGQLHHRPPSPAEIPRLQESSITETPVTSSTRAYSTVKMSSEEVSSTKEQAKPGCPFSPSALFDPKRLHPCVTQLVYWQDPKKSGGVFGGLLVLLLSLNFFSLISVASYLALGVLGVTLSFRIYKNILQAVQKSGEGHPLKEYLEYDLTVPQDKVHDTADTLVKHVNSTMQKLRSLFLVEDLVDSIKLGIVLWCLTYLGSWFNGLTLIILGVIAIFTLPKLYESNQTLIDQYISLVGNQVSGVVNVVKSKIPFGKKEKSQ